MAQCLLPIKTELFHACTDEKCEQFDLIIPKDELKLNYNFFKGQTWTRNYRSFIINMPPARWDTMILESLAEGFFMQFFEMLIRPRNDRERMLHNKYDMKKYSEIVLGKQFVDSMVKNITTVQYEFDDNVRNWLERNFVLDKPEKPRWVTFKEGDNLNAADPDLWILGPSRDIEKDYDKDLLDGYIDKIYDLEDRYYGDQETDKINDTVGPRFDLEYEFDTLNNIKRTPKRDMKIVLEGTESDGLNVARIFGPLNSFADSECKTHKLDGCRMLTCTCHEDDDMWFSGSCDYCNRIIKNVSSAVRYPKEFGGWIGTYCCIECLQAYDEADFETLDELESILLDVGIMDRDVI